MPGAYTQALRHAFALLDEVQAADGEHLRALHRRYASGDLPLERWLASLAQAPLDRSSLEGFACALSRTLRPEPAVRAAVGASR